MTLQVAQGKLFTGYWSGGCETDPTKITPLDQVPAYIQSVNLAFYGLNPQGQIIDTFVEGSFTSEQVLGWAATLRGRGQQIRMSILDSDAVHYDVAVAHLADFLASIPPMITKWNSSGIDWDCEGPAIDSLKVLIPNVRTTVGAELPMSLTVYTGSTDEMDIITTVKDSITYIQTMDYGSDLTSKFQLAEGYAKALGTDEAPAYDRVVIGIAPEITPFEMIAPLCQQAKAQGYKGVMLWALDSDNQAHGEPTLFEYAQEIENQMGEPVAPTRREDDGVLTTLYRVAAYVPNLLWSYVPSMKTS